MNNQVGAKTCRHGRQFCAECHTHDPVPVFDPKLRSRVSELENAIEKFRDNPISQNKFAMFRLVELA